MTRYLYNKKNHNDSRILLRRWLRLVLRQVSLNFLHGFVYHLNLSVFYLCLPYAKGNARPDSDFDIALFLSELNWGRLRDIGGVHMDPEASLGKKIDLSVST